MPTSTREKEQRERSPERLVKPPVTKPGTPRRVWDEVDEASWESFPASDPPSYSPPERTHKKADAG